MNLSGPIDLDLTQVDFNQPGFWSITRHNSTSSYTTPDRAAEQDDASRLAANQKLKKNKNKMEKSQKNKKIMKRKKILW